MTCGPAGVDGAPDARCVDSRGMLVNPLEASLDLEEWQRLRGKVTDVEALVKDLGAVLHRHGVGPQAAHIPAAERGKPRSRGPSPYWTITAYNDRASQTLRGVAGILQTAREDLQAAKQHLNRNKPS